MRGPSASYLIGGPRLSRGRVAKPRQLAVLAMCMSRSLMPATTSHFGSSYTACP
jgi:hypothetical protein